MPETKAVSVGDDGSDFFETLLDIVNPLQHLPVVSTIYRAITGDEISVPARLIGGALYGGPLGFASTTANMVFEQATGDDLAGHALALIDEVEDALDIVAAPASAAAATAPETQVTNLAAADSGVEIIWNGPRVLPSLARSEAVQVGAAGDAVLSGSGSETSASDIAPLTHHGGPIAPSATEATSPRLAARPAWLEAAIADAQLVHGAAQQGKAAQKVDAQPWVTDAMLEALGKYETMARERNR
jgi:hypothetical protein